MVLENSAIAFPRLKHQFNLSRLLGNQRDRFHHERGYVGNERDRFHHKRN
ncbi:hypothetical protein [Calothrix sp. NIES-2100]